MGHPKKYHTLKYFPFYLLFKSLSNFEFETVKWRDTMKTLFDDHLIISNMKLFAISLQIYALVSKPKFVSVQSKKNVMWFLEDRFGTRALLETNY